MKIAINCAFFQPQSGGIKEYVRNLVKNLSEYDTTNDYVLYVLSDYLDYAKSELDTRFRIKTIPFNGKGLVNTVIRSAFEQFFWTREEKSEGWDVFHSPFFHAPRLKKAKLILTVHDLRLIRYPETYTFLRYRFLRRAVRDSVRRADRIISVSRFTKNELIEAYGIEDDRISVVHEAVDPAHFDDASLSPDETRLVSNLKDSPFILSVGHLEPRKNYDRLIEAFQKIKPDLPPSSRLVIIGKKGHHYHSALKRMEQDPDITYLNFVSQGLLNHLYKDAALLVFPSFYEGFGFPPLEAGIHGTVSAVSRASSLPEICGNAAAYFDPMSVDSIAGAVLQAMTDEEIRRNLQTNMARRLTEFSWKKNALATIDIYSGCTGADKTANN